MSSEIVKIIPIKRMDCPTCILTLEKQIKKIPGVKDVKGNYLKKTINVTFTESSHLVSIEKVIEDLGYEISYKKYPSPFDRIKGFLKQDFSEIQPLSDKDFGIKVLQAKKVVAVLFGSRSCPACQLVKPKYNQLANKYKGELQFFEMDVEFSDTWKNYDVLGIPTIIIFKNGETIENFTSTLNINELEKSLTDSK
ncbi:hypothetical protein FJY84_01280 [Candidatus Bathyarchaeota archaeon]|nr:hypothetical protein [Candidatus Bathyarchaeota archaeon]